MATVTEKQIEQYLVKQAKLYGGKAFKWISPGNNGVPDRIVILPGAIIGFLEMKAPGKTSTALQLRVQEWLRKRGFPVFTDVDSKLKVDLALGELAQNRRVYPHTRGD